MITTDSNSCIALNDLKGTVAVTHINRTYYRSRTSPNHRQRLRVYFSNGAIVRITLPYTSGTGAMCYEVLSYIKKLRTQKKIGFSFRGNREITHEMKDKTNDKIASKLGFSYDIFRVRRVQEL